MFSALAAIAPTAIASSVSLPITVGIASTAVKESVGLSALKCTRVAAAAPATISTVQDRKLPMPAARPVFRREVRAGR